MFIIYKFQISRIFRRIRPSALLGGRQCQDQLAGKLRLRQPAVHLGARQRRGGVHRPQGHRPALQGHLQPQPDARRRLGYDRRPRVGPGDGVRHASQPDDVAVLRHVPPTVWADPRSLSGQQLEDQVHQRKSDLKGGSLRDSQADQLGHGAGGNGYGSQLTFRGLENVFNL